MTDQPKVPDPSPEDVFTGALKTFHASHVREIWAKALARRIDDPANAITLARTLLESVCKIILDGTSTKYSHGLPLPRLYELTTEALIVSPTPTTEEVFERTLKGCADVVWGIGMLRNFLSDSHGRGIAGAGTTPDWRHAELAINLAGAMATYLLAIWENRQPTLAALVDQILPNIKGETHRLGLQALRTRSIGAKVAAWLTVDDLVEHCQMRIASGAAPATVNQDFSFISGVLRRGGLSTEVMRQARPALVAQGLIGPSKKRLRRPTPEEIGRVLDVFRGSFPHPRTVNPMVTLIEFALASGRRVSEIMSLKWKDLDRENRTCAVNGKRFRLLGRAYDIIVAQPEVNERIFPYKPKSISTSFSKPELKKLKACTFNDLRLEAMCRMLEAGYSIEEVSDATGQKDHNVIANIKRLLVDLPRSALQKEAEVSAAAE